MNESDEVNLDPIRQHEKSSVQLANRNGAHARAEANGRGTFVSDPGAGQNSGATVSVAEIFALLEAILRRWHWIFVTGLICAAGGLFAGLHHWETRYSARAQLALFDASHVAEVFKPKPYLVPSLPKLIQSPEVLRRVSSEAHPPISADELAANLKIIPERNSEFVTAAVSGRTPAQVVELINLFAQEAVRFTQKLQAQEASELKRYIQTQIVQVDKELEAQNLKLQSLLSTLPRTGGRSATLTAKLTQDLDAAQEELAKLLLDFTPEFPKVKRLQERIKSLQEQLADAGSTGAGNSGTNSTNSLVQESKSSALSTNLASGTFSESQPEIESARRQVDSLVHDRLTFLGRQYAAEYFEQHPVGYYKLYAPARLEDAVTHSRKMKVILLALFSGVLGMSIPAFVVLLREFLDGHLKTREDVRRVTGLPVIAGLGDLKALDEAARSRSAFRAWLSIKRRLFVPAERGIVCGIIASSPGEGSSTWVNLLAKAASECGARVLTITPPIAVDGKDAGRTLAEQTADKNSQAVVPILGGTDVLASPTQITQHLVGSHRQPVVHLMLPEWAWNGEGRHQWQSALDHWSQIENLVILIGLPPASLHNAVLLAQEIPNLIWLSECGETQAREAQQNVDILRQAGCNLVGAVLNRERHSFLNNALPRWRAQSQ